jgi:hypothetical protein
VRVLSLARVLFALLAFQLAVGMQVGVAQAAAMPAAAPVPTHGSHATGSDDACPMHSSSSQTSQHTKISHVEAARDQAPDKHDCCRSSGCQCQCGNVPLAFNVSVVRSAPAAALVRPALAAGAPIAPPDTHFRPPILS